jgi:predicted permease
VPRLDEVDIDLRVLLFTTAVSVLAGLVLGLVPALQHRRLQLRSAIDDRSVGSSLAGRWSELLVIGQVAIAMILMVAAVLMIRSFSNLLAVDTGFASERLLVVRIRVPSEVPGEPFFRQVQRRVGALAGVSGCSSTSYLPFAHPGYEVQYQTGSSISQLADEKGLVAGVQQVTPGLFKTMGIQLLEGRDFTWDDVASASRPVIVSRRLATEGWPPGTSPVGQTFASAPFPEPVQVVGVVGDRLQASLEQSPRPTFYYAGARTGFATYLVVRTSTDPARLAAAVRTTVSELEPRVSILQVVPMQDLVLTSVARPRFVRWLSAALSGLATAMALVGIYGVMTYHVAQRTPEIGVRMSFGATGRDITRMQLRRGLRLVLAGVAIGMAVALGLSRLLASLLFEVGATDPASFLGAGLLLLAAALPACLLPALRASRTDPITALRYE